MRVSLPMESLFNHKVFLSHDSKLLPEQGVSFFGGNRFFDINTINLVENCGEITVNLGEISELEYDNVICSGQSISVPFSELFTTIHFVGFSDRGSFADNCTIKRTDGSEESICIAFNDWARNSAEKYQYKFDFSVVPKKRVFLGTDSKGDRMALTYCSSSLMKTGEPVNCIVLPDNPLLHICFIILSN